MKYSFHLKQLQKKNGDKEEVAAHEGWRGWNMNGIWHISELDLMLRVFISAGLGGLIGLEREWSNHSAGLRTHILVCIGSTVIMLLSMYGFSGYIGDESVRMDLARLAAQVISGIGFLGAGAILRNGSTVPD